MLKRVVSLIGLLLLAGCATSPGNKELSSHSHSHSSGTSVIRVAAVGDIMLGSDYPAARLPDGGGDMLLGPVTTQLQAADVTVGNLEGVLLDGGTAEKRCTSSACYLFRTPTHYAAALRKAGFDVVSLANNHARDFGEAGRDSTMKALDGVGILHSGRIGDVASWSVKGRRIAFVAFSPFAGSWPMLDMATATEAIRTVAANHDIVIVSVHAGAEGDGATRVPFATELFHGENRGDVAAFAHAAIDAGADLVLGHGPHVPRGLELYRNRLVAYSLGNFCTYWGIKVSGNAGLAPILVADLGPDGEFVGGRVVSAIQIRPKGPVPDGENRAARLMQQVSELDFPNSRLQIGTEGELWSMRPAFAAVSESSAR